MDYGNVINDLRESNNYFSKLLYKHICPLENIVMERNENIVMERNENREILGYYDKRRGQKKMYNFIYKHYFRDVLNNFKVNFLLKSVI